MELDGISDNSFCRVQKRKQVGAILEYIKQYNEENDGIVKIVYSFDHNYSFIAVAWIGTLDTVEIIDIDEFFIEIFK